MNIYRKDNYLVAHLFGEVDHHVASSIREKIDREIAKSAPEKLIFDFSSVSFMDSSGIGVIIGRYKKMREIGGQVSLVGINQRIGKLIAVSGLSKITQVCKNLKEAM